MKMYCEIISQDREVFSGDVNMVVIPGAAGQMGILPNHAALLTAINYGVITIKFDSGEEHFTVAGGVAEVLPGQVIILADAAENVEEIDIERAIKAKQAAEESLKNISDTDNDRYMRVSAALKRSYLRLDAAKKFRRDLKIKG